MRDQVETPVEESEGRMLQRGGLATVTSEGVGASTDEEPVFLRDLPLVGVPSPPLFVDDGGPVIDRVSVLPIFWGRAWSAAPQPTQQQVMDAFRAILASPYLSRLHQYRASLRYRWPREAGSLRGSIAVDYDVGSSSASAPRADAGEVARLIENLFMVQRLPFPDPNLLYVVLLPPGVGGSSSGSTWSASGEHFSIKTVTPPFRVAWVGNAGFLESVTALFSHELVEAITDPEGSSIIGPFPTCGEHHRGWCEIADICENHFVWMSNGVLVQKYWSEEDSACIVPSDYLPDPFHEYVHP